MIQPLNKLSFSRQPYRCVAGCGRWVPGLIALAVCLAFLSVLDSRPAHAAAIYLKNEDRPVLGFITSKTVTHVTIQYWENDERKERVIPVSEIEEVVLTVSPEKLAALDTARLAEYRDYAEELAVKRIDPEARETAIRLFLIAAHFGEPVLRQSALRGLVPLSRNPIEKRRFLALAYRYGAIDSLGASQSEPSSKSSGQLTDEQRKALVNAIRMARAGNLRRARMIAEDANLEKVFADHGLGISHQELLAALQGEEVSTENLIRLLVLELTISEPGGLPEEVRQQDADFWGDLVTRGKTEPVATLDIASITEFNPVDCFYSAGNWLDHKP